MQCPPPSNTHICFAPSKWSFGEGSMPSPCHLVFLRKHNALLVVSALGKVQRVVVGVTTGVTQVPDALCCLSGPCLLSCHLSVAVFCNGELRCSEWAIGIL